MSKPRQNADEQGWIIPWWYPDVEPSLLPCLCAYVGGRRCQKLYIRNLSEWCCMREQVWAIDQGLTDDPYKWEA